ncbi:MAG: hypothetical protein MZW92_24085 [Comamonadaceae bacterium]|nr:hypothetical protein [Comamonadaceae bacterium]
MADVVLLVRACRRVPSRAATPTVESYFDALLYTGTDPRVPGRPLEPHWTSTAELQPLLRRGPHARLWRRGRRATRCSASPTGRCYVRARRAALRLPRRRACVRGDEIVSIDGVAAADLIAADDYSLLTADSAGQHARPRAAARRPPGRSVTLTATEYPLTPVPTHAVVTSPLGRRLGYVVVKRHDLRRRCTPLEQAFASFRAAGRRRDRARPALQRRRPGVDGGDGRPPTSPAPAATASRSRRCCYNDQRRPTATEASASARWRPPPASPASSC